MVESKGNALVSMSGPKKAMTRTMGSLGKMHPRASKRDFFRASRRKCTSTSKIGPAVDGLRGNYRPASKTSSRRWAGPEVTTAAMVSASASLRSVRTEIQNLRGGNDARRKAWKTQTPSFPPFPLRLEIRPKAPDSHIPTASTAISLYLKPFRAPPRPFVDEH
ncbi:MAG: hypothetical protein DMG32_06835 [Acidobacteria bacterium]|nr:MAG: hypothetical protein DMG32_06835 [Acidobacteriota bacterium]